MNSRTALRHLAFALVFAFFPWLDTREPEFEVEVHHDDHSGKMRKPRPR